MLSCKTILNDFALFISSVQDSESAFAFSSSEYNILASFPLTFIALFKFASNVFVNDVSNIFSFASLTGSLPIIETFSTEVS